MKLNFLTCSSPAYMKRCDVLWTSILKYYPNAHIHLDRINDLPINQSYDPEKVKKTFTSILDRFNDGWATCALIDADCELFGTFDEIEYLLETSDVVLVPHIPYPSSKRSHACELYQTGYVNGGLITFRNSSNAKRMINWIIDNARQDEKQNGAFYEQTWVSSIPYLFDNVGILRDKRYNVAYWTLKAGIEIDFNDIKMMHYSGFEEGSPFISKHYKEEIPLAWEAVFERYRKLIS